MLQIVYVYVMSCYVIICDVLFALCGSFEDGAAREKNRLEEKQRAARKQRGGDSSWKPRF